jgi:hypothetical protein
MHGINRSNVGAPVPLLHRFSLAETFLSPLRSQTLSIYITASGTDTKTHIHIKHVKTASPNSASTLDHHALAIDRELHTNKLQRNRQPKLQGFNQNDFTASRQSQETQILGAQSKAQP